MKISVEGKWGVIDGAPRDIRQNLVNVLHTETTVVGDRLKFMPTRDVLDYLAHSKQFEFAPECRNEWRRFYKTKQIQVPDDIDFRFKSNPYPHQREWWYHAKDLKAFALEWEMGLGKTKTALDIVAWAATQGTLDGLLVVTLKDVHRNWIEKEIPEHFPLKDFTSAYWNSNRVEGGMRGIVEAKNFAIAAVNFDVVHRKKGEAFCKKFLANRKAMLVIDESHNIKTPSAERTKALLRLGKLAQRRMILTGTPITQGPLDAWAQYTFLDPRIIDHMNFYQFKARYAVEQQVPGVTYEAWVKDKPTGKSVKIEKPVKTVVGYRNLDDLKERLDPFRSRLLKDDVLDLPEKTYRLRSFTMTDEMHKAYMTMKDQFIIDLESGQRVTAQMALTKLLRLQQLVCGFTVPDDMVLNEDTLGMPVGKVNPRLEALMRTVEEVQGKAIIWSSFRFSQRQIVELLRESYGSDAVVTYTGETADDDRARNVRAFQDADNKARFLVGSPQAGGTGITLTRARDVIYYNNSFNLALRLQSEDRAHRIGQTGTVTYTDLEALGTVDRQLLKALREKRDVASSITGDDLKSWLSAAS